MCTGTWTFHCSVETSEIDLFRGVACHCPTLKVKTLCVYMYIRELGKWRPALQRERGEREREREREEREREREMREREIV